MIVSVTLEKTTLASKLHRSKPARPTSPEAIGLAAAIDYLEQIRRAAIFEHNARLTNYAITRFAELPGTRVLGPARTARRRRLSWTRLVRTT